MTKAKRNSKKKVGGGKMMTDAQMRKMMAQQLERRMGKGKMPMKSTARKATKKRTGAKRRTK